jgi:hypothetical protein
MVTRRDTRLHLKFLNQFYWWQHQLLVLHHDYSDLIPSFGHYSDLIPSLGHYSDLIPSLGRRQGQHLPLDIWPFATGYRRQNQTWYLQMDNLTVY